MSGKTVMVIVFGIRSDRYEEPVAFVVPLHSIDGGYEPLLDGVDEDELASCDQLLYAEPVPAEDASAYLMERSQGGSWGRWEQISRQS